MRSDSVKNMSAYADQNHAPSLTDVRLEFIVSYRRGMCARERFLWGKVCYYSGYCLQVIFREVFCHVYGKIPRHTGAIVAVAANYFRGEGNLHLRLSGLRSIISGKLASTFAIIRLVVNFFWEIGIYICNSRNCSLLFLGNWHLHLRLSGLQSTFPGEFSSTFVILGLAVIFFRDIGIYICDSRNCSLLFPGYWHLHL